MTTSKLQEICIEVDLIQFITIHIYDLVNEDYPAYFKQNIPMMIHLYFVWFRTINSQHTEWLETIITPDGDSNISKLIAECQKVLNERNYDKKVLLDGEPHDIQLTAQHMLDASVCYSATQSVIITWAVLYDNGACSANCSKAQKIQVPSGNDKFLQYLPSIPSQYKSPLIFAYVNCETSLLPTTPFARYMIWGRYKDRRFILAIRDFEFITHDKNRCGVYKYPPLMDWIVGISPTTERFRQMIATGRKIYDQYLQQRAEMSSQSEATAPNRPTPQQPGKLHIIRPLNIERNALMLRIYIDLVAKFWGDLGLIVDAVCYGVPLHTRDAAAASVALVVGASCVCYYDGWLIHRKPKFVPNVKERDLVNPMSPPES